ncbi:Bax inhibitor-1 family protein, partial [Azospirillum brasilense]
MSGPFYGNQFGSAAPAYGAAFDEGLRKHMLRVYNFMMLGLAVTGMVALFVASTPALYVPIFTTPLKWVVMLAPLAFIMVLSFRFHAMSASAL